MPDAAPPHDPTDAQRIQAMRAYAQSHGAIMAVSGRFCPSGTYWADIIQPGYATIATARTPLQAATAAIAQYNRDNPATQPGGSLEVGRYAA